MAKQNLPPDFVDTANRRFKEAQRFWSNWRAEAYDDYAFIAGDQWLADDEKILKEEKRPPVTFNYSEKMIDAVVGAEVSNRQEVTYHPREISDSGLAELWTNAAKWVRDEANVEDEETEHFRDCLICGMGWTHTRVSYDTDLDGMIEVNRVDPLEMVPDPSATKPGLIDRRYSFRIGWIDEREAKRQWPDALAYAEEVEQSAGVDVIRRGNRYEGDETENPDLHRGQVQIRHYECVETTPVYRVASEKQIIEVDSAEFSKMKKGLDEQGIRYVKQYKRTYYYAYFANETLLEADLSPCQVGFTYQCTTGKRDRNRNYWYGLTKVMKDPQRWANKWLSQILHIINSNAKGGLLAEVGAFMDPQRAQDEWANPEAITLLKEGGLAKVKEKQMTGYPTGLDRLMEFALSSLPQVTGINLEALGLAAREQANVLEQSRKQAAYGLLAPVFDSLRRYRKNQGRVLLDFIHNYISDGRLIRVGGNEASQFMPLTKVKDAPRYDIIVDQSPQAPDVKEKTWMVLQQIIPAMMKVGIPVPPEVLDFAPIPTALAIKWKKFLASNGGGDPSEKIKQMQQQLQKMMEENQQLKFKLHDKSQEFALKKAETEQQMQLRKQETAANISLMQQKARADHMLKRAQVSADIDANMADIFQGHANDASSNILDAVNKLIETVARLEAEEAADKDD